MKILGVLPGGPWEGSHFKKLFNNTIQIKSVQDVVKCTHLLLWGGEDICPALYGEWPNRFCQAGLVPSARDQLEWNCLLYAKGNHVPAIGVCRGAQMLCAFHDGKLAQDIGGHGNNNHDVITNTGEVFSTCGDHHQMMLLPSDAEVLATTTKQWTDCYIDKSNAVNNFPKGFLEPEAAFFPTTNSVGFQFHPEWAGPKDRSVTWALETIEQYCM